MRAAARPEFTRPAGATHACRKDTVVEQARNLGVHRVARSVRVDYYSLKRRVGSATNPAAGSPSPTSPPGFIEVTLGAVSAPSCCVIELQRPDGARMAVRMAAPADLVGLAGVFLNPRRTR